MATAIKRPSKQLTAPRTVESLIHLIRGQKVMLDSDLAELYGVPTKRLNEAVKRNPDRFPTRFMFPLTHKEIASMRSQIATASKRNIRYQPLAFTEHGVVMLSSVLNSARAVEMSILVVDAFVRMRELISSTTSADCRCLWSDFWLYLIGVPGFCTVCDWRNAN